VEWVTAALAAFVVVVPVELPDKTFVATLVLATRFQPLPVWLGVTAAFGVQCLVAVVAGRLLGLLPDRPVKFGVAALFAIGSVILFLGARKADLEEVRNEQAYQAKIGNRSSRLRAFGTSFVILFAAEWGDLTQILSASLVAAGRPAGAVFIGSWVALATVAAAGVILGRVLLKHLRLSLIRYLGATVCAALAVFTLVTAF
jgi:putative Ca2+/H+ antiporter (TMEM165/GDT1 family)